MISVTSSLDGPAASFDFHMKGLAIFLDNFAIINLAKGDRRRRQRFIAAFHKSCDLLFSVSNAVELAGPQGKSLESVRLFLDELGPRWFPVELSATDVVERERAYEKAPTTFVSKKFAKDYMNFRISQCEPGTGKIIDLSQGSLRLGTVLDWVMPQRDSIKRASAELDGALRAKIVEYRQRSDQDCEWLDRKFPHLPNFRSDMPATFTYVNLIRNLVIEAKSHAVKKNDGIDFCQSVIASSFASVATLDKHWKRRIDNLPKPNGLAHVYCATELDEMVSDIEAWTLSVDNTG